uniref:Angiotensin II receptor associated protein n=1 Tax=Scleropages formosus TaxID=113540 RepID=A0A8C9VCE6_SCLFO
MGIQILSVILVLCRGTTAWLTLSYAWANFSMLALGVWAVAQRDSTDAALMFLLGMIITMLTDAVHFGLYYTPPGSLPLKAVDTYRFSMATAISSLLLKPFSCFFIYREYRVRGGEYSIGKHLGRGARWTQYHIPVRGANPGLGLLSL